MSKLSTNSHKNMSSLPSWVWPNSNSLPSVYKKIWESVQEEKCKPDGVHNEILVDTNKIFPLLLTSQLPTEILGFIWSLANQKYAGQLTEQELYIVLSLVALAQTSCSFDSLEILQFIHTPPIPNLNLSFINVYNHDLKVQESSSDTSLSLNTKKPENLHQPINKLDDLSVNVDKFSNYNNSKMKEIKVSLDQQPLHDTSEISIHRQNLHVQPEIKHHYPSDSVDEFCDFQSAPVNSSGNLHIWDLKQGSAIGSRLANHNLGVKKSSDKTKRTLTSKSNTSNQNSVTTNFSFPNKNLQLCQQSSDHYLKCPQKNQTKTVILKDTAIRNRDPCTLAQHSIANSSNTSEKKISNANSSLTKPTNFSNVESLSTIQSKKSKEDLLQQDLMSLQPSEDKYSALRELVDAPVITSDLVPNTESITLPADDFGDFVSAEQISPVPIYNSLNTTNSLDLSSHFESNSSNSTFTCSKPSSQLIEEVTDMVDILTFNQPLEKKIELKSDINYNLGKNVQKEKSPTENTAELSNTSTMNSPIRSESAQSLDLKLASRQENERLESDFQNIYWKWKQYMESSILLLKVAANIFTSITSEVVLREVLTSAQGYDFLCDLAEIAAVCRRINFSHKEMDINIIDFDALMVDIDKIWSEMEPFYSNIPIVTELPAWPFHSEDISCALCLTSITSGRVMYNKFNYHVTCANLWLHTVNSDLPILQYPVSFQESNFIESSTNIG